MASKPEHYRVELAQTNSETARKTITVTQGLISALHKQREIDLGKWRKAEEMYAGLKREGVEVMKANKHLKRESIEMKHVEALEKKHERRALEAHHFEEINKIRNLEKEIKEDIEYAEKIAKEEEAYLKDSAESIAKDIRILQSFLHTLEASKGKSHYSHAELEKLHEEYMIVHRNVISRQVELRKEIKLEDAQRAIEAKIRSLEASLHKFHSATKDLLKKEKRK